MLKSVSNNPVENTPEPGDAKPQVKDNAPAKLGDPAAGVVTVTPATPTFPWVPVVSAIAILALFALLFNFMIGKVNDASPDAWNRFLLLYNSVQTIVVAAASALLGVQITSGQAATARAQEATAKSRTAQLETNIKSFQADLAAGQSQSERGLVDPVPGRFLTRAMLLLH